MEIIDPTYVTAAFINALSEEGTKEEAMHYLQKYWSENCALLDRNSDLTKRNYALVKENDLLRRENDRLRNKLLLRSV
jgi:regulator of replication initiation timing